MRSFVLEHKNVCPTCGERLTQETPIDNRVGDAVYDKPSKLFSSLSNLDRIARDRIISRNSEQDSDEDEDDVQSKRTFRKPEIQKDKNSAESILKT